MSDFVKGLKMGAQAFKSKKSDAPGTSMSARPTDAEREDRENE